MAEIEFNFNGVKTIIQCNTNDTMKDIMNKYSIEIGKDVKSLYILYDSNCINEDSMEKTIYEIANNTDKNSKKMTILVYEIISNIEKKKKTKSKEIICPICKENIRINIINYKINLF